MDIHLNLSIDGVFLLYWLFLNADRPFAPLSRPPPPRDKTKYESVRLKKLPAFYLWLESQTFSTHWFSQLLQKSSYTCSTPQSDSMCLARKSYQNWSKDKGIRVPYWERRVILTVPDFDSECCQFITSLHVGSPLSGAGVAGYFWRFRFFFGELLKLFRPFQMKGT